MAEKDASQGLARKTRSCVLQHNQQPRLVKKDTRAVYRKRPMARPNNVSMASTAQKFQSETRTASPKREFKGLSQNGAKVAPDLQTQGKRKPLASQKQDLLSLRRVTWRWAICLHWLFGFFALWVQRARQKRVKWLLNRIGTCANRDKVLID